MKKIIFCLALVSLPVSCFKNDSESKPDAAVTQDAARDGGGEQGGDNTLVDAAVPDETPPVAAIASPARYEILQGTAEISAEATDEGGVSKVILLVNGEEAGEKTEPPFTFQLDTTSLDDGFITVSASAFDAAGNKGDSAEVRLIAANNGQAVSFTEGEPDGVFEIPANYYVGMEVDEKYHWDMPAGIREILAVLAWDEEGWKLEFTIGTGFCPHSGLKRAGAESEAGFVELQYSGEEVGVSNRQWFAHIAPKNLLDHVGESLPYVMKVVLLEE